MAAYRCDKCGMSVGSMTCGQCGKELVHDTVTKGEASIHVSKCPDGHGMVKSPMCCGQDMTCSIYQPSAVGVAPAPPAAVRLEPGGQMR